ncbi:hypothetical protein V5O48_011622 [Marasmius crinis-equi]|uniref:Nephrocystin 3-like N-terminal domain-containing protein n=1 Tax=Marasmius crinis-equi TaxID=585013 RepID=A0ABR3F530_9AGAR
METHNTNTGSGSQYNNNGPGLQNIHIGANIDRKLLFRFWGTRGLTRFAARKVLWEEIKGVGASHRAEQQYARGECLEGTREEVLADIHGWRISRSGAFPPILWLSGAAGIGKTSIAMSIAKSCEDDGLVCSFFFFRTDSRRNNPSSLMLSIAHGLAVTNASAREAISDIITANPALLEAQLEDQFKELVLQPSAAAVLQGKSQSQVRQSRSEGPDLVIIDGLDECSDEETQLRILSTIASGYRRSPQFPLRFLVCSRSESWLQEAFDAQPLHPLTKHLALDRDTIPGEDIERYYRHEFDGIRTSPKYRRIRFPVPWPSKEALRRLLENSSGQFVYAVTATGFVKSGSFNPVKQLQIILEYSPEKQLSKSPFPQLDRLYYIVVCASTGNDEGGAQRNTLVSILAVILLVSESCARPSPEFIELLLGLSEGEVDLALRSMHSVLDIRGSTDSIRVFHTSFTEYLQDELRSGQFYIDEEKQHRSLASFWLRALAREAIASPKIILKPDSRSQPVGDLIDGWAAFCLQDDLMMDPEFSCEVDSVCYAILSAFPSRDQLIAQLASVRLLPSHKLAHQLHVNDTVIGLASGDVLSTLELLESCRLATSRKKTGSEDVCPLLSPFLVDFLANPTRSGEFFLEKETQHRSLALRWIQTLAIPEPGSIPGPAGKHG